MSLIGYHQGVLIADRNCEERDAGLTFAQSEQIKIHRSSCGSVVAAVSGDVKEATRTTYLLDVIAVKLRIHELENTESVFKSSIVIENSEQFFGLDSNAWIFMTEAGGWILVDDQLIPVPEDHITCNGTMRASLHLLVLNGLSIEDAARRTLTISACSTRTLDVIKRDDLPPLYMDAEIVAGIEQVKTKLAKRFSKDTKEKEPE